MQMLGRIAKEVDEDPGMWRREEEYMRKFGTLIEEDLRMTFTI